MRDDLVGEFVGQTAPRTKRVLERAMGGVLFIDEAYYLYRASDSKDYGQEAIEILLQVMENERENLVVVLAGYKDRMDHFFTSNPGMSSRITHHLDFAPYDVGDLAAIGELMLDRSRYHLSAAAELAFRQNLQRQMAEPDFANARSVRNELDRARLRHAYRLAAEPNRDWSREDLMRLEPEDMLEGYTASGPARQPNRGAAGTLRPAASRRTRCGTTAACPPGSPRRWTLDDAGQGQSACAGRRAARCRRQSAGAAQCPMPPAGSA